MLRPKVHSTCCRVLALRWSRRAVWLLALVLVLVLHAPLQAVCMLHTVQVLLLLSSLPPLLLLLH